MERMKGILTIVEGAAPEAAIGWVHSWQRYGFIALLWLRAVVLASSWFEYMVK